ncbi:MAG: hypothetical protein L6U99_06375 [Clostridium sp.]|nr:MAG: hypothetical protein L6U99_06375 [Clostridium sp.]
MKNMFIEGGFNAISGVLSILGGYLGGIAGVHNRVFTKLLSKKRRFLAKVIIRKCLYCWIQINQCINKNHIFMI